MEVPEVTKLTIMKWSHAWNFSRMGRGGDLVVSVLACYSGDPSSNPTEA